MEENLALKLLRILRRNSKGEPLTDAEVRKLTGLHQMDIDIAAAQLEAEGMLTVERTYTLVEEKPVGGADLAVGQHPQLVNLSANRRPETVLNFAAHEI